MNQIAPIYRYTFNDPFNQALYRFAQIHQYDDRKVFKEAWKQWREENDELFRTEIERHKKQGYQGDIEDKIFKSARYYYRKKSNRTTTTEKKAPDTINQKKSHYVNVNKDFLESIDDYIQNNLHKKPADSFEKYCKESQEILKKEIGFLYDHKNIRTLEEIKNKIKKTYKNRYYTLIQKRSINYEK